ncbi:hypothetical protein [Dactylosporangium sp. NPDC000521]|uniref:hypothetical protein n=1 Tax=Dactylosporangium sp. NPDC000521 TaxID=3363975 RepID=UPI00369D3D81
MTRSAARAAVAVVLGVLAALGYIAPAGAHGADAPAAVDYVVSVASVSEPGVTVRAVEGGARLELRSESDRTVVVLGMQGEPFLRISGDGVAENRSSPTWVASRSLTGTAKGGATTEPAWHQVSRQRTVRWHDERARELPARAWSVPLEIDGSTPGIIRGVITKAEPPATGWWWSGALLAAVAIGLATPRSRIALAVVAGVAGAVVVAWIVVSAQLATSPAENLGTQLLARLWPLLTGVGVLAAAGMLALRKSAANLVAAIGGACLAVMTGFADAGVFSNGALAGPGWSRWAVAGALAGGLGLLAGGATSWYRTPVKGTPMEDRTSDSEN